MTSEPFGTDNYMPDWNDEFDFGAFLNLPADEADQGDMSGAERTYLRLEFTGRVGQVLAGTSQGSSPMMRQELPRANPHVHPIISNTVTEGPSYECSCIACLSVGAVKDWPDHGMSCRFPNCSYFTEGHSDHILHERSHFQKAGSAAFCCVELVCPFTSKRWPDLVRHYTVKHCTSPKKFQYPCPMAWCKYSGNNGFARKDKLKSHYKNIHEGKPGPVKAGRVIKPVTLKPRVSGLEASESKHKE